MNKIKQKTLGGKVIATFIPTKNFDSPEFKSTYIKDMTYNIREGNTKLVSAVKVWREEGLVK